MGKFEGMDPKLVRDLLSEVQRAAEQMRSVEGRVSQMMSGAGLSAPVDPQARPDRRRVRCDGPRRLRPRDAAGEEGQPECDGAPHRAEGR
ncbi:hypothetical protein GCM10018952_19070 [Streptosporangium vulgare]